MTVAATVCSEHTYAAAIPSEASGGEPNTTDPATESTSSKEPHEHQPETDNDLQESLLLYSDCRRSDAATVCSEKVLDRIAKKVDDQKAALSCALCWMSVVSLIMGTGSEFDEGRGRKL